MMTRDQDVEKLQEIIEDRVLIDELRETKAWRDIIEPKLLAQVDQWKKRILSDEFINDHNGYIKALTHVQDLSDMLALVTSYERAGDRAIKSLETYKEQTNAQ